MSTAMQNYAPTPSYFFTGQHFLGDIDVSPRNNRNHKLTVTTSFLSSNSNMTFATPMANISSSHIQQCLNLTIHFSLRHLAANMISQLYHNFISLLYFFPSYKTCSINVNSLSFLSSNNNTTFATPMANMSSSHIQQCLNLTIHFSLRHLAANMLSQLYHNFISLLYFFPSYETCSINVTPLFHAAIKNII